MSHRVMIVEDESLVAEDLHQCLEQFGYEVVGVADSAESARRLARDQVPDLALLDIRLKGAVDGIELAQELRDQRIGFVYLTSHADAHTLSRARATEPLGYVLKPFDRREIHPVLEMAVYRHQNDRQLRAMERWLSTTLHSIGDGVLVTDAQLRVSFLNPAMERCCGHSLREAVGLPVGEVLRLVAGTSQEPLPCIAARALQQQAIVYLEPDAELVRRDGSRLPIDDCAAPIRDGDRVTGVVVVCRDARQRRELERRQREADQRVEEAKRMQSLAVLAGGVAHDVNNALTAILGGVAACREGNAAERALALDRIEARVGAVAALCRQLLAGAGAAPLAPEVVVVAPALAAVVAAEREFVGERISVSVEVEPPLLAVLADPVQFGQVVQNLLRNAAEALLARGGAIAVRAGQLRLPGQHLADAQIGAGLAAGDYAWFEFADDGPGMPPDVRARVFEPFFTTKLSGRGLGLASVHGIVRRHGGAIQVVSEVGVGSLFRVLWPMPPAAPAVPESVRRTRCVAVVDDDRGVREVAANLLRLRGLRAAEFPAGEVLLAAVAAGQRFDAVVLDIAMPGLDGVATLDALRVANPALPVLMVSGNADFTALQQRRDPCLAWLAKPFDGHGLHRALERLWQQITSRPAP
ncbi:MAG: response regulator [Planctomycetes bacterium]|nr:response regulator [Planctomycetota bacterium]